MKIKKIFKRSIALELISKKNLLMYTEQNRQKKWLVVFCFEQTDKLLIELTEINNREKINK